MQTENNIPDYTGLLFTCPSCERKRVEFNVEGVGRCDCCNEIYSVDEICPSCESLINGNCFACKMD